MTRGSLRCGSPVMAGVVVPSAICRPFRTDRADDVVARACRQQGDPALKELIAEPRGRSLTDPPQPRHRCRVARRAIEAARRHRAPASSARRRRR